MSRGFIEGVRFASLDEPSLPAPQVDQLYEKLYVPAGMFGSWHEVSGDVLP